MTTTTMGSPLPKLAAPDMTHAVELGIYAGQLYSPQVHNLMVASLQVNGIIGDLDAKVQAFVNVQPAHAANILARAKKLRGETP